MKIIPPQSAYYAFLWSTWCWLLSDTQYTHRYCSQYSNCPYFLGVLRASKENPINHLKQPSILFLSTSVILHMFFIPYVKRHLSFMTFASSFPSLLGDIYYFIPNHARAYRVVRCWMVSPPTESNREGMLQETRRRFPAPCRPSLKKTLENSLYERRQLCKIRFHCTAFFIKLCGYPLWIMKEVIKKLINIQNQ